jgi:hypothetical protein
MGGRKKAVPWPKGWGRGGGASGSRRTALAFTDPPLELGLTKVPLPILAEAVSVGVLEST